MGSTSGLRGPMRSMNVLEVSLMIKITRPVRPVPNILPDALHGTHSMIVASTRELANVIFISANDRNICPQQRSVGTELEPALAGLSFSLSSCAVCLTGRGNDR